MQWSSVFKAVGFVFIVALGVITFFYQQDEKADLMILFGLYSLTGILGAFFFFKVVIPALGESITTAMVESGEKPDEPPMVRIRALIAQGEYATAVDDLRVIASENPGEKIPWMERSKLQQEHLHDLDGAIATLENALSAHEWEEEDGAFFLFRMVELNEEKGDTEGAISVLERIIESYPQTRYSANANHKKRELEKGPPPMV